MWATERLRQAGGGEEAREKGRKRQGNNEWQA